MYLCAHGLFGGALGIGEHMGLHGESHCQTEYSQEERHQSEIVLHRV